MIPFLILCVGAGIVFAIPVWIVSQRFGARRGLQAARRFNPDDAVPCVIEPVALRGRLMPDLDRVEDDGERSEPGGAQ
ncbi:hypothetical protein [Trinickia dinghuensis]|uniref:Uncharacterized protein n=1 Tax=Trinickia dinghuensis TaxID=2291023 RepID=A0A3D8K030_9BURK|nr:hypothetical protein [Trinickia dinghuensis]RDU98658.1 hypothetical protein DWV00_10275 [Trinickia dinghuensis]